MYDPAMGCMTDPNGMTDASDVTIRHDVPVYDPSMGGMNPAPSCFTIEFFDGSFLKEGQTVFVSYDGGGGLVDSNENSINSFSQIVNNSSTTKLSTTTRLLQR